ncbi:uncharacterized protein TRAVEDRAFT_151611 [Trametes versicolor FP-101664 SS1]|uniref:uncharacterized protein n=1 Tax=Trametes versicolor (strain FP-101664) TaxID=717944 RepID=UPI0004621309|nr:uncharacterized protein TRAVEDRAFT_151611 [Trametes versicolor FP-101664 SS1]EIW56963.1 hypothetical protein TRAVEDRAFT_151611 [Trametes versicolor FP-101664 SS1]
MAESTDATTNSLAGLSVSNAVDASRPDAFPGVVRHQEYWFDDGSVVVIAQDTAYKIHKSMLARHSEVFNGLFSVPQTSADDHLDGCPVVPVPDSSADFSNLLKALYDTSRDSSLFQLDRRLSFSVVAGLYELAHKYQIDHLMEQMLVRLKSCFTDNLREWDALDHVTTGHGQRYTVVRSPSLEVLSSTDAIRAINLARRTGALTMLPAAIYLASFHHADVLLTGIARPDGTLDTLSREDLVRCLDARVLFAHWTYTKLAWITTGRVTTGCKTPAACADALTALSMKIKQGFSKPKAAYFALDPFAEVVKELTKEYGVCKKCGTAMRARAVEERRVMWRNLPQDLGLDLEDWGKS